jgi:hypothetical protein
MKGSILYLVLLLTFVSCAEEVFTQNNDDASLTTNTVETFDLDYCAQMKPVKPPVDILYLIDNSGSTLASSFQEIKSQIQSTINTISKDFDYHIYFAPLNASAQDSIQGYPLIVSDPSSIPNIASVNIIQPENLNMFAQASGNNSEHGLQRVKSIIDFNRGNGIFRNNANTITVMISNGDDTQTQTTIGGNIVFDPIVYAQLRDGFKAYTSKYAQSNTITNPLNLESFRFISLVAHSACNGWKKGTTYKMMSADLYDYQGLSDNSTNKDSYDLCSQNYSNMFNAVNNSIKAIIEGYHYDHWRISSANESQIQENDITLIKYNKKNGTSENIPTGAVNGFEYLGYKADQNTRYLPSLGEPATGLIVKLNGTARVIYPDCVIAKTRTPTEYFGYFAIPRDPEISTIRVEIRGQVIPQSAANGWSFLGWRDTLNIKVPGPTDASTIPELNKSGYFLQLHGNAIFTNGETINVYYKPKAN